MSKHLLPLAVAVSVALALRAVWIHTTNTQLIPDSDTEFYYLVAKNIVSGHGYVIDYAKGVGWTAGGQATAFFPPGYPLFLAGVYAVFGGGVQTAIWANAVLAALSVVPVYFIGLRLFGQRAAIGGALLTAVFPSFVIQTPVVLTEPLFLLLFASSVAVLLQGRGKNLWLAGILVGLSALVRPMALLLVPAILIWWLYEGTARREAILHAAFLSALALLVILPWSVRNFVVLGKPVLISTNFGYNLRIGHAPYSTGTFIPPSDLWSDTRSTFQQQELEVFDGVGVSRAAGYALSHPLREVELSFMKVGKLWLPDFESIGWARSGHQHTALPLDIGILDLVVLCGQVLVVGLAARGILRSPSRSSVHFIVILMVSWTLAHVVFFGQPRFNLPILIVLTTVAAAVPLGQPAAEESEQISVWAERSTPTSEAA